MSKEERYCPRCMILHEMALNPDKTWSIVLPPHDPACEKVAIPHPKPLRGAIR